MHPYLRYPLVANYRVASLVRWLFTVRNGRVAVQEAERRAGLPMSEAEQLAAPLPYAPDDATLANQWYGLGRALKRYAGLDGERTRMHAYVEHGLFFGSTVLGEEHLYPVSHIVTFGDRREQWLREAGITKGIMKVGPMIHYAPPLGADEAERLAQCKRELGRVLLFFPSHSIKEEIVRPVDVPRLIGQIRELGRGFDTVLISVFWKDMEQTDLVQAYRAAGFHLVTSGYKLDRYFLSRQRFLIQLADATASNSVGTHIGYCVHLDRPHTLIDTEYRVEAAGLLSQHWAHLGDTDRSRAIWLEETEEVASHFRHASGSISAAQRAVVDKYWGTSYVRTRDEMRDFILSTRHL